METGDNKILINDISARVLYDLQVEYGENLYTLESVNRYDEVQLCGCNFTVSYYEVKPYLRPISDMTTEECERLFEILRIDENRGDWLKINDIGIIRLTSVIGKDFYEIAQALCYLNSIHIDYNGLIEKGLAKRAPEGMYNF